MTTSPHSTPNGAARPDQADDDTPHGNAAPPTAGDVPITIWRLDDRDATLADTTPDARPRSRLAQRLVQVYTSLGEAVVDFDSDLQLQRATIHASRSYLAVTEPAEIADLDTLTAPVSLIVLRWPPRQAHATAASITDLFAACRFIMTTDACAIVAVSPAEHGIAGTDHADHLDELLPAAQASGLSHTLRIVVLDAPGDHDEFLYYATTAEAAAARRDGPDGDDGPAYQVDLLVFAR